MPWDHPTSRRHVLLGLTVGGSAALLAACGGAATVSQAGTAASASATVTSSVAAPSSTALSSATSASPTASAAVAPAGATVAIQAATRGGSDGQIMSKTAAEFTRQNPGIKVTAVSYGPEPQYWSKLQALYATDQLADVLWASTGNQSGLANKGIFLALDSVISTDKYDMSDYLQNALTSLSLHGKLYGMPWGCHPGNGGLNYNATQLQKAGFATVTADPSTVLTWTYDTLMQAAIKATQRSGGRVQVYGYLPGIDYLSLTNVIGAYGGDFLSADGTKLTMDTKAIQQGMQWVADAFVTHKVAPAPSSNGDQLFDSQKLSMELTGYWGQFQPGIKNNAFQWNDSLQPVGPTGKRGTHLTINGQSIAAKTKHTAAAWDFVKFLMSPQQNIAIVLSGGGRPAARKSVLDSPVLMQKMKSHKVWVPDIETAEPWRQPANFRWPEFNTTIQQAFGDLWVGKQSVEQAISQAKPLLQAILDKPPA